MSDLRRFIPFEFHPENSDNDFNLFVFSKLDSPPPNAEEQQERIHLEYLE